MLPLDWSRLNARLPKGDSMRNVCSSAGTRLALRATVFLVSSCSVVAQTDPGPRGASSSGNVDSPHTGDPLGNLTSGETAAFNSGKITFQELDSVSGTLEFGSGLGPRFNLDSCAGCHAFPAIGGSSPQATHRLRWPQRRERKMIPSFISANGPIREARFVKGARRPDGAYRSVRHSGRSDAAGCAQFATGFRGAP